MRSGGQSFINSEVRTHTTTRRVVAPRFRISKHTTMIPLDADLSEALSKENSHEDMYEPGGAIEKRITRSAIYAN